MSLRRLHRDEQGTISLLTVFAVLLLMMLLGMVMNVGRQVDGKIRMQNAADAAAYSGGVVLARGMNTLSFTNHLLCDVFAMTAFMREANQRNAESHVEKILGAWQKVAPVFTSSGFPKFAALGPAILQKVPLETQLVTAYGDWASASAEQILPLMEEILLRELISEYQRAVVEAFPDVAQAAAMEIARRNGQPDFGRGNMLGVLWRTSGVPVGGAYELFDPTFPVVDPVLDMLPNQAQYVSTARSQRKNLSHQYLNDWNGQAMYVFDREAKMCQFGALWRSYTCGQLNQLLEVEYPYHNLPFVIRSDEDDIDDPNGHLERHFTFVAVAYWKKLPEMAPGVFKNPIDGDATAFAQVRVFVPTGRLVWRWHGSSGSAGSPPIGGVPGEFPDMPGFEPPSGPDGGDGSGYWTVGRQGVLTGWDLLNQHWTCQLVPATGPNLATILQTVPTVPGLEGEEITLPSLGGLGDEDIGRISTH